MYSIISERHVKRDLSRGLSISYLPWQLHPWPQAAADENHLHVQKLCEYGICASYNRQLPWLSALWKDHVKSLSAQNQSAVSPTCSSGTLGSTCKDELDAPEGRFGAPDVPRHRF